MMKKSAVFSQVTAFAAQRLPVAVCGAMIVALLALAGCGPSEPFKYVKVSGKVTYEDGTLIPADPLLLVFMPMADPVDPKTYPRPGMAQVDKATGEFKAATSHRANDGLVRGKHKVTLAGAFNMVLPTSIVPAEYGDSDRTPLEVDTEKLPFELKVKKPGSKK